MVKTKRGLPEMTYIPERDLYRKRGTYKGQKYNITAKKPEDVMSKIELFKTQVDTGVVDENITLWQYVQRWYPSRVADLKPKSKEAIDNVLDNHIIPKLGNTQIREIKPLHIRELMAAMVALSTSLNHKTLTTLKNIFDSAIENNIIVKNPCTGIRAGGKQAKPKETLTDTQQETLATAVRGTRAELFTLLCLYAGLRREEALGLLWESVYLDVETPYITVRHTTTLESNGNATHSSDLKTNAAYRTIPIPPQLSEALYRRRGEKDSRFVVPSETKGEEMSLSAFRRMWEIVTGRTRKLKTKDAQGNEIVQKSPGLVSFDVHPHLLRHTYVTQLCMTNMDIKKIQYLAGHEDVTITLKIYAKVRGNKPGELAPDIISAFSGTLTGTPNSNMQFADK